MVALYLAGFRNVELHEMENPFVFSVPQGSLSAANYVAFTYPMRIYGMTESFAGRLDWAPIGEADSGLSADWELLAAVWEAPPEIAGAWPYGSRWGVPPEAQRHWLSWASYVPLAGRH